MLADVTYLRMSVLLFVCLQVHAADECICSLPREVTWRCYCSSHADMSLHLLGCLLPTALARQVKKSNWHRPSACRSVCPSVRLFPLYLLNRLTFDLEFCVCVDHDHVSTGIESQGHWSRSKVNVQRIWACNAVMRSV